MAVLVEKLLETLIKNIDTCDEIVIISGYSSPDVIARIAKLGKPTLFYYGMYGAEGITERQLTSFRNLQKEYSNLKIRLVFKHRVHTKAYLFVNNNEIKHAMIGSANFSSNGLMGVKNSEMLVELNDTELIQGSPYLSQLEIYRDDIDSISIDCTDSKVITRAKVTPKQSTFRKKGREVFPLTGNPHVAIMPFYSIDKGKKTINKHSGINWGLQSGHVKKSGSYTEAYIPVTSTLVDNYPIIFPPFSDIRTTTEGKITRRSDPVTVLWDDGVVMQMIFSGTGVERPTKGNRKQGDPFREYPKQFTSADGGGEELGKYLRNRMGVVSKGLITLSDFKKYGRDYITLTYISPGYYEADFSNDK